MRNIGPLEERQLIQELYGYYSDVSSRGDKQGWLSCWTDDCRWKTALFEDQGKQAIDQRWNILWADFEVISFLANVGFVHVEGDRAQGRAVTQEWIKMTNGSTSRLMGYYEDELRRENDIWLFSSRTYVCTGNEIYSDPVS